ncbi:MAG: AraC family transcriptional regulator [Ancylobacter novellus]|uniref:AraC family transcriptional regulator n=1 Tax=Ancylobacter novellus TaxID=921 RepID=A0A2W5KC61_ANCNO|nr:MAG: AraC family transcriptional regulator [Ancylobacter novellus]
MTLALTRASTMGPVVEAVEEAGGSARRLFRDADLPIALLERPDAIILLKDQFRLVERAARLIGDDALPARLSLRAGLDGLGPYGRRILSFPDLGAALSLAYLEYGRLLQAATLTELRFRDGMAVWSYEITAPLTLGRQKNELLALGYMLTLVRKFAGPRWCPGHIEIPGSLAGKAQIEQAFRSEIHVGPKAALVFPVSWLECPAPDVPPVEDRSIDVPAEDDLPEVVRLMIGLERDAGRFGVAAVAARLGMTRRTLQRKLSRSGRTFSALSTESDLDASKDMLSSGRSVTETAIRLGYQDVAHFSRAFCRWTGAPPSLWRRSI